MLAKNKSISTVKQRQVFKKEMNMLFDTSVKNAADVILSKKKSQRMRDLPMFHSWMIKGGRVKL